MTHPLPADLLANCDGFFICVARYMNDVTNDIFWTGILLTFCVLLFTATSPFGTTRAFGYAGVVGLLGAMWLAILNLMAWWVASAFIIVGGIGFVALIMREK